MQHILPDSLDPVILSMGAGVAVVTFYLLFSLRVQLSMQAGTGRRFWQVNALVAAATGIGVSLTLGLLAARLPLALAFGIPVQGLVLALSLLVGLLTLAGRTEAELVSGWRAALPLFFGLGLVGVQQLVIGQLSIAPVASEGSLQRVVALPFALCGLAVILLSGMMLAMDARTVLFFAQRSSEADEVMFTVARSGILIYLNPKAERLIDRKLEQVRGRAASAVLPEPLWSFLATPLKRLHREPRVPSFEIYYEPSGQWYEVNFLPWPDYVAVVLRDLTTQKKLEEQVRYQATHDGLTGLANRAHFYDQLEGSLREQREGIGLLFLDLDDFKRVNDSWGHATGDQVLVEVARRIEGCARPGDLVARLGGDEFAILRRATTEAEAVDMARQLLAVMGEPFAIGDRAHTVGVSIGIAMSSAADESVDHLLRGADMAMYRVKAGGKANLEVNRS